LCEEVSRELEPTTPTALSTVEVAIPENTHGKTKAF